MAEDELEPGDTPQTEWLKKNEPETLPSGAKQKSEVPGVIEVVDKVLEVAGKVVTPILATVALADEATEAAEELRQVVGGRKKEAEPGVLSHFEKLQQRILSTSTTKWPLTARTELIKERDEMVRRAQGWGVFTGLGMAVTNVMKSSDWDSVVSDLKQLADARDREMRRRNVDYDGNSDYYGIVEETIVGLARDVQLDGLERMTEEKRAESGVTPQEFENMRQRAEQGRIITLNDGKPKPEEIMNLGLDTGRLVDLNARKEKHRADEQLQEDRRRADEATRVSREEKERQRQHELELEKAKAEAAARGQAGSGGMDRLAPPDLRSAPEIYHDDSFFSADTLVALGIPATFYRQEGFGPYTWVDVVGLLNTYATTGVLMDESDMRALNKALALAESETPNLIGKGLLNLLKLRRKQDGTIDVYAGVENNKNSSILNETEFSFKFSAKMISKCPNMLATVLVCFEIVDGEDGSSLAVRMRDKYDIVFANSKEENQPEVDRQMGEMKKELARELSIDLGSVECVMAYVLAWGGQTANWRWGQMRERYKEIGKQEVGYLRSFVERIKVDNESLGNVLRVAGGDAFLRVVQKVPDGALLEYWNNLGSFRSFLETGRLILIGQGEGAGTENPAARERILAEHIKKNFKERWKFDLSVIKRQFDALSKRKGMAPATQETRIKTLGGFLRRIRDAF